MFMMARQVQIATDAAKGLVGQLSGVDAPVFEDTEETLAELKTRVIKTVDFLNSISPEQLDGTDSL